MLYYFHLKANDQKNSEKFSSMVFNYFWITTYDLPTQSKKNAMLGISALILLSTVILSVGLNSSSAYADSGNTGPHKTQIIDKPLPPGSPIATPQKSATAPPPSGPTDSLQVRMGYKYPCGIDICSQVVQDWTALPYQTLTGISGTTKEADTWIQPWYELRAGFTGVYNGNRLTDVNDPDGNNMYSNSGTWVFDEANILEPAHQDMDQIFNNGNGVPLGSLIFHDFYFSSYSPS
jgi:hypothetical protein